MVHCSLKSSCSSRNSFSFLFPPTFIFSNSEGFHLSIVADRTKLKWTPFRVLIITNGYLSELKFAKFKNFLVINDAVHGRCDMRRYGHTIKMIFQAGSKTWVTSSTVKFCLSLTGRNRLRYRELREYGFCGHETGTGCSRTLPRPRCLPEHCRQIHIP